MEKKILEANINGKTIIGKTNKELVYNCLKELYNQCKEMPPEERLKAYVNYFVDIFSYDWNLADETLKGNRKETSSLNEEELANLFINNAGVCNQFAKALSLLSCFDKDIQINYCYCNVLTKDKVDAGHAINTCIINNKPSIVDISSMIHSKEKFYKQNKSAFGFIDFDTYINNLKKENILYKDIVYDNYILGTIRYFKEFENNYLILSFTADEINANDDFRYNLWKIPVTQEENNFGI